MARGRCSTIPFFLLTLLLGGCVLALPGYNEPFEEHIAIISDSPEMYTVRIDGAPDVEIAVPADGRVEVPFPVLPRECNTYFLGMKVRDRSVTERKLLLIARDDRIVRRLSVRQLRKLPPDSQGYYQLRVR